MIGATTGNSDIKAYLTPDEIDTQLENETLTGPLFQGEEVGKFEVSLDDGITEKFEVDIEKPEDVITHMHLRIKASEFGRLKERRAIGAHEGFRHISVDDVETLSRFELLSYHYLLGKLDKKKELA